MTLKLPRLTSTLVLIDPATGKATKEFSRYWDTFAHNIETAVNGLADTVAAVQAAQAAADAANDAAAAAASAATDAQTAADNAQNVADTVSASSDINNSYVTGLTLTATDAGANATISISAHTRVYGDGSTVAVNSGSLTGRAYSTDYWVYYDDPARTGGAVTYQSTTTYATAFPNGTHPDRHFVGAVHTPAAAGSPSTGNGAKPPGYTAA